MGLEDAVGLSLVDPIRDERGWAFTGASFVDEVNAFSFLSEAYLASDPAYDARVSVPVLWDRKRGVIVLLSDFLAPLERLQADLLAITAGGHEVILFQVLDPAELAFEFGESAMFQDLESGRTLFIDPASARNEYLRKLEAHCAGLRATCQRLGVACHRLATDRPLELALFDFMRERMQRRRQVLHGGRHSARKYA